MGYSEICFWIASGLARTCTTSKHSVEFPYRDFPCRLKVNRDKLALIKLIVDGSVKNKRLAITANLFREINQHDNSTRCERAGWENPATSGTNLISQFVEVCLLTNWEKILELKHLLHAYQRIHHQYKQVFLCLVAHHCKEAHHIKLLTIPKVKMPGY